MRPARRLPGLTAAIAVMVLLPSVATADGGAITGRFVLDGEVPAAEVLFSKGDDSIKDGCICAAEAILRNDLVIDKTTRGIRHIFVYLPEAPAQQQLPASQKKPLPEIVVRVKQCRFTPHTVIVRAGQTIRLKSEDAIAHHAHPFWFRTTPFGNVSRLTDPKVFTPERAERVPVRVQCDLHSWMRGYWLVVDHPYAAITAKNGTFHIGNLPAGKHHFITWHERVGYVNAGERRGFEIEVVEGETTDLGTIKVPLKVFGE